jgi:hypothetical protein
MLVSGHYRSSSVMLKLTLDMNNIPQLSLELCLIDSWSSNHDINADLYQLGAIAPLRDPESSVLVLNKNL